MEIVPALATQSVRELYVRYLNTHARITLHPEETGVGPKQEVELAFTYALAIFDAVNKKELKSFSEFETAVNGCASPVRS